MTEAIGTLTEENFLHLGDHFSIGKAFENFVGMVSNLEANSGGEEFQAFIPHRGPFAHEVVKQGDPFSAETRGCQSKANDIMLQ